MPEKILTIDNSTFFVTCRIGEELQDVQSIQWFLAGDNQRLLADQTCQSVSWMPPGLPNRQKENGLAAGIFWTEFNTKKCCVFCPVT